MESQNLKIQLITILLKTIVERIGNLEDVKVMAGNQDYMQWLKDYLKKYNEEHYKKEVITIKKNNKKIIEANKNSLKPHK